MAAQKSPFLGVNYGWSLGEDSWNVGMDDNLRQFSALLYKVVDGIVTDVPAMNSGQMYYSTLDNTINYNIDGITYRQVVPVGFSFTDKVTGISYKYDGNSVSPEFSQSSGDSRYVLQSSTTPFSLTLLAASTAAASRGVLGLGTASTQATGFFEPAITAGTNVQFWRGDKTFQDLGAFIRSNSLTGLSLATSTPITAADTTLSGFGKLQGQVTLKAPLASPALTGIPTAPTASAGTNTDQIATTAFVAAASASTAVSAIAPIKVKTDRTLAPSATHPVKRDDGSDLQVGDSYPNTVKNDAYFWNGAEWNSSAQQLEEILTDPVAPENGAAVLGRGVISIATLASLMALPVSASRSDLRYLVAEYASGTGVGGGPWRWSGLNMSAAVAADPYRGLVAPPISDPTGASGAFYREFTGVMYADWFGVVYGSTVDVTARLQAALLHVRAGRGLVARGDVRVDGTWDMSNLPMAWRIHVEGTIYAGPGPQTTTRIAGIYTDFQAFRYEKIGGVRQGLALECLSMFMGDIKVMSIDKFGNGAQFIGIHSRPNGVNGIAWCHVDIRNINVADIPVLITTRTDTPGKTNGYVNENLFKIGYMGGRKGIWCKEGPEQTGGPFGGNKFEKPGFEQITDVNEAALDLEFCSRTTITDWRFEGPGIKGLQIRENSKCSRNVYRGSHSLTDTKLEFNGLLVSIDAEIITAEGGLVAAGAKQLGNDSALSYITGDAWNSRVPGDAIEQRVRGATLGYPDRVQVKTPLGVAGFLEVLTQNWYMAAPGIPVVDVIPGTRHVSTSVSATGVDIRMPVALEINGREIRLEITAFASGGVVRIFKGSGAQTAGAGVTSAGLYSLAYRGDQWRISKIGEAYSS